MAFHYIKPLKSFHISPPSKKEVEKAKAIAMEMTFLRKLGIMAMFLAAVFVGSKGQQTICNMPISGLMACQPAVTGSNPPKPTDACCSALGQADLTCLCGLKSSLPGYGIDPKQAMKLPAKCKLTAPKKC